MNRKGLGSRVKAARRERGMTGEKLAENCNINATYLRQIEAGTKTPSLPMFVELCRQLNVSPTYLLSDSLEERGGSIDSLTKLMETATPSQAELITRMVESALSMLNVEQ